MSDRAPISYIATYCVAAPLIGMGLASWIAIRHRGDWLRTTCSILGGFIFLIAIAGSIRLWKRTRQR
jgi:hypothetical protein